MPDTFIQKITEGKAIREIIREAIGSRTVCKVSFAETENGWITSFLDIRETAASPQILIDKAKGFEAALSRNPNGELSLEFRDKDQIPCFFKSRAMETNALGILIELPAEMQRIQRREYFRVEAPMGAKITFLGPSGKKEGAVLADLGGGGAAFLISKESRLDVEHVLENVWIYIPTERIQSREYFRAGTPVGSEISFADPSGRKDSGILIDVGGGGASFLMPGEPRFQGGEVLKSLRLQIPQENGAVSIEVPEAAVQSIQEKQGGHTLIALDYDDIPERLRRQITGCIQGLQKNALLMEAARAVVRRVQEREDERVMIGIEFLEIAERVRKEIIAYIFERQRSTIRRIGK